MIFAASNFLRKRLRTIQTFYRGSLSPCIIHDARINRCVNSGLKVARNAVRHRGIRRTAHARPNARTHERTNALDGIEKNEVRHDRRPGGDAIGRRDAGRSEDGRSARQPGETTWATARADALVVDADGITAEAIHAGTAAAHRNAPPPRPRHHAAASPAAVGAHPPPSARYSAIAFASLSSLSRISSCPDSYVLRCASSSSRYVATPPA